MAEDKRKGKFVGGKGQSKVTDSPGRHRCATGSDKLRAGRQVRGVVRKNAAGGSRVHQEAKTRSRVQEVDEIAAGGQVSYNPPAAGAFSGRRFCQEQGSRQ